MLARTVLEARANAGLRYFLISFLVWKGMKKKQELSIVFIIMLLYNSYDLLGCASSVLKQ